MRRCNHKHNTCSIRPRSAPRRPLARQRRALVGRRLTPRRANSDGYRRRSWPARRNPMKHPLYAVVLTNLRPVDRLTCADEAKVCSLHRRHLGQPPRPSQRHTDHAAVHQMRDNLVCRNPRLFNAGIAAKQCSCHASRTTLPRPPLQPISSPSTLEPKAEQARSDHLIIMCTPTDSPSQGAQIRYQ
jgi:hypothetical protein